MVRAREGWKSRTLMMTGEGGEGKKLYLYAVTKTGDARLGGWYRAEAGWRRRKGRRDVGRQEERLGRDNMCM